MKFRVGFKSFFFSSRRRHTRLVSDWSSDVCSSDLVVTLAGEGVLGGLLLLKGDMRPDRALTLRLAMIMLPYVLLICGTALLGGVLQVHRRFAAPAAAPILLNVCHIVVIVLGAAALGLRPHDPDAARVE